MFDFPNAPALNDVYTPSGGPTWQWNGTVWLQVASPLIVVPQGRCYLDFSGANVILYRKDGSQLWINGRNETIPAAGVTLAPTGVLGSTNYAIYAYMNAGVMTLEYAQYTLSVPVIDAASGMKVKPGDASRTFVGLAYAGSAGAWATARRTLICSQFNPEWRTDLSSVQNPTTTSTGVIELSSSLRVGFVAIGGRETRYSYQSTPYVSVAAADTYTTIGFDGVNGLLAGLRSTRQSAGGGSNQMPQYIGGSTIFAEGYHFITPLASVSATNTGTWLGGWTEVTIQG